MTTDGRVFEFGEFRLEVATNTLRRGKRAQVLSGKLADVLVALVDSGGRVLPKDELLAQIWPDTSAHDGNLNRNISTLRKILHDSPGSPRFIQTIARVGYRFLPPVQRLNPYAPSAPIRIAANTYSSHGREKEIGVIQNALRRVTKGATMLLCVSGESGIGKSELLDESLKRLRFSRGVHLASASGDADRIHNGTVGGPLLQALRRLLDSNTHQSVRKSVEHTAPAWHLLLQRQPHPPAAPGVLKMQMAALVALLSRSLPMVLILDDFQSADAFTIDVLTYLVSQPQRCRLLAIVAYRTAELRRSKPQFFQVKRDLEARKLCHEISLHQLESRAPASDAISNATGDGIPRAAELPPGLVYEFGDFLFDPGARTLSLLGRERPLSPKILATLTMLVEHSERIVSKDELLQRVWPDSFVEEVGLSRNISVLREMLRESRHNKPYIETIPKVGYRFSAKVRALGEASLILDRLSLHRSDKRPVVGRDAEQSVLSAAMEALSFGKGQFLCVSGEAGIGKTTLIEEFLAGLVEREDLVYAGRGRSSERLAGSEGYLPIIETLGSLGGADRAKVLSDLSRLAPTWWALLSPQRLADGDSSGSSVLAHERLKRELIAFLKFLCRERPVILFFDDVHWADASTLDILSHLAEMMGVMRMMCILAYRGNEALLSNASFPREKSRWKTQSVFRELPLDFLSREATEDYLRLCFTDHAFPDGFSKLIHAKTEGNPLFMSDVLRFLQDDGTIQRNDGQWKLSQQFSDLHSEMPQSIRSLVERKIEQLQEADRQLLLGASIQGAEFDSAVLATGLKMKADDVRHRLERLERNHAFIRKLGRRKFPTGRRTECYAFVHIVYQNELFAVLSPEQKSRWSMSIRTALQISYGDQLETVAAQLAYLCELAGDHSGACDFLLLASRHSRASFALHEAIGLASKGLETCSKMADSPERNEKEMAFLSILAKYHLELRSTAALEACIQYSQRAIERQPNSAFAYSMLADAYAVISSYGGVAPRQYVPLAQSAALKALEIGGVSARPHAVLGFVKLMYEWDWRGAIEQFETALKTKPDPTTYQWYGLCYAGIGCLEDAIAVTEKGLTIDPQSLIVASQIGWLLYFNRRYDVAVKRLLRILELAPGFWRAYLNLGWCYMNLQMYPEAVGQLERARNLNNDSNTSTILAQAYALNGQRELAFEVLREAKQVGTYASPYWISHFHLALGDFDEAFKFLAQAIADREWFSILLGVDPEIDPIRNDPRYLELVRHAGLPHHQSSDANHEPAQREASSTTL